MRQISVGPLGKPLNQTSHCGLMLNNVFISTLHDGGVDEAKFSACFL